MPYPKGLVRFAMRMPILLYRIRLGWLLGRRFLLLEHRGRKSGALRHAVIEVVDHNPADGSYVVAAAWGKRSDWYKNILAEPHVAITVGCRRLAVLARTISQEEAAQHLAAYAKKNPWAFRELGALLIGQASRDPADIIQSFVLAVPLVQFSPFGGAA